MLREPLVLFLLAGAGLYLLHDLTGDDEAGAGSRQIIVDRAALLRYMQYQARAFEPDTFAASFDAMDAAQRAQLAAEYVKEEVLYREAQALGLAQGDYVMRQRLVQKMSFLLEPELAEDPATEVLQQYLQANEPLYRVEPAWTFTHVFLDPQVHGGSRGAEQVARRLLAQLRSRNAGFNDAPAYGDRFPFMQNYVERTADYVDSHFGGTFTAALQALPANQDWQGPLESGHGWHLVMLTAHTPGRAPGLAEIRERVREDWRRDRAAALQEQAVRALVESYDVELRGVEIGE